VPLQPEEAQDRMHNDKFPGICAWAVAGWLQDLTSYKSNSIRQYGGSIRELGGRSHGSHPARARFASKRWYCMIWISQDVYIRSATKRTRLNARHARWSRLTYHLELLRDCPSESFSSVSLARITEVRRTGYWTQQVRSYKHACFCA